VKNIFSSSVECNADNSAVVLIMILREFFRHDEEDQSRLLKESNTTSPPQYAEFMVCVVVFGRWLLGEETHSFVQTEKQVEG